MKKFKIPAIPPTTPKCIRFPDDLIKEIEEIISKSQGNCDFTSFVLASIRFSIENLEE